MLGYRRGCGGIPIYFSTVTIAHHLSFIPLFTRPTPHAARVLAVAKVQSFVTTGHCTVPLFLASSRNFPPSHGANRLRSETESIPEANS